MIALSKICLHTVDTCSLNNSMWNSWILYSPFYGCCWSGIVKSHTVINHVIDLVLADGSGSMHRRLEEVSQRLACQNIATLLLMDACPVRKPNLWNPLYTRLCSPSVYGHSMCLWYNWCWRTDLVGGISYFLFRGLPGTICKVCWLTRPYRCNEFGKHFYNQCLYIYIYIYDI